MPTQEEVMANLDTLLIPGAMRSPVKMNLVHDVIVADGRVDVTLASATLMKEVQ